MGWLWASSSAAKPSSPAQDKPASTPANTAPNEPNIDPEIQKFLDLLSSDTGSKHDSSSKATAPSPSSKPDAESSSSWSSWLSLKANRSQSETPLDAPRRDAVSESLLPTDMSCRQAFDLAWACNSVGGQWNAVYRHGEMRSCSDQWDDFWFCMRSRGLSGPAKAEAIREHYRNREYAKYYAPGRPSSEDVWRPREQKLPPGAAFSKSIDAAIGNDDEWRRQENERRREVRKNLDFDGVPSDEVPST
ncbi:Early meiotic induction protein-like protein [Hapsidospora chrysogenum ATCC 11550]|uniref:Early meiotic induction protein-like protein n=1 Tax=Hapsidospora chrysogenum (strain ATCC 11550 / CBS 779.69 / DSM 880 / IAM 14645 / JCM 23072 / IMI 49137) TaxID=857340 RepID=A0A086TBM3_HAPC1|nr:Early meiotic induction protein-like protein [Hapsidospora chrysogenum ATCC 11550]